EVMQLIACAERKPLRRRLNALAIARTDQSRHVERAHLSPCFVTQHRSRNGLSQRPSSSLQSDVLLAMVGPSKKPTTHESQKKVIWESRAREKSAKVVLELKINELVCRPQENKYDEPADRN